MSGAMSSVWLWLILVFAIFIKSSSAGQEIITAESGQDNITLLCRAPNNKTTHVEWRRTDLEEQYVLLHRDGHLYTDNQHLSFENRVDLQDKQMKDGDVSLILKNVTINDTGTYKCRVVETGTFGLKLISVIYLRVVDPPGQTGGHTEDGGKKDRGKEDGPYATGLSVPAVLLAIVGGLLIYTRYRKQHQDTNKLEKLDSSSSPSLDSLDNGSQRCKETAVVVLI